jgi:hypothetical protein
MGIPARGLGLAMPQKMLHLVQTGTVVDGNRSVSMPQIVDSKVNDTSTP